MAPEATASLLSAAQIEMLIRHIDGYCPVILDKEESPTRIALLRRKLLCYPGWACVTSRPCVTALTELGKEVICIVLGRYADHLHRNMLTRETSENVIDELVRRMKMEKRPETMETTA
jgi:hypothetical protein